MVKFISLLFSFIIVSTSVLFAQEFTARVDRNPVSEQDTFNLYLTLSAKADQETPDLSRLEKDFEVLGKSQSSQYTIINGQSSSTTTWEITLAPKRSGKLLIPPIQIGSFQSNPISMQITSTQTQSNTNQNLEYFIEAKVDSNSVYMNAQLILTIQLFSRLSIQSGSLSEPEPANATIEQIGNDKSFNTQINGVNYQVIERKYAIFPETNGTLNISPITFSGVVSSPAKMRGRSLFDNFFASQRGKRIHMRSQSLKIKVLPKPPQFTGQWWLPARKFNLSEEWSPATTSFKVGEPVTRTISMVAAGLMPSFLPKLQPAALEEIKSYPDQAQIDQSFSQLGLIAKRIEKTAFVATKPGSYILPEVRIPWWDTEQNKMQFAVLPQRSIQILPAYNTQTSEQDQNRALTNLSSPKSKPGTASSIIDTSNIWPWVSALLAIGWFINLLLLWKLKPKLNTARQEDQEEKTTESLNAARKALHFACKKNDPLKTRAALIKWSRARWANREINNLTALMDLMNTPETTEALRNLDRVLYAEEQIEWDGEQFLKEITIGINNSQGKKADSLPLPRLYPQTLQSWSR